MVITFLVVGGVSPLPKMSHVGHPSAISILFDKKWSHLTSCSGSFLGALNAVVYYLLHFLTACELFSFFSHVENRHLCVFENLNKEEVFPKMYFSYIIWDFHCF